jgi:hypothetical protein
MTSKLMDEQMDKLMREICEIPDPVVQRIARSGNYRAILDFLCAEYKKLDKKTRLAFLDGLVKHVPFHKLPVLIEWQMCRQGYDYMDVRRDLYIGLIELVEVLLEERKRS